MTYNHKEIERKWQEKWEKDDIYRAKDKFNKPASAKATAGEDKFYCLIEFPYPSGEGLHVGHPRSYTAMDIIARKKRMEGKNVLYPIGWDAFGLPTENYAIKTGVHPKIATEKNIKNFTRQLKSLGFSFDWSREINTTDPAYYKWTQWMFLQFFKHGLAYKKKMAINWCLKCKIGLANEEVVNGKCERCGGEVEKRQKEQWMIKITKYAERLIDDLEKVDYLPQIKEQQINWIGKSEGAEVDFRVVIASEAKQSYDRGIAASLPSVAPRNDIIKVFTTRPDTLFGATYMVLAPEHELVQKLSAQGGSTFGGKSQISNLKEVEEYIEKSKRKSDLERTELQKEKTGVEIKGIKAINPVNNEEIPVWVADYVLTGYGTGAIMAVPAHDERDFEFAFYRGLPIKWVVEPPIDLAIDNDHFFYPPKDSRVTSGELTNKQKLESLNKKIEDLHLGRNCYMGEGKAVNSDFLDGLKTIEAKKKITEWLEKNNVGKRAVNYKLRDWVFSRQRYWGEPIPLIFCGNCKKLVENSKSKTLNSKQIQNPKSKIQNFNQGELLNPGWVLDENLPIKLPDVKKYEPTDSGESPLANMEDWINMKCPKCGGGAKRETDTMPNWAGSSWYFLRYTDPKNNKEFASAEAIKNFMPVDWYNGGMEHVTLHLLYSRFWYKFLFDIGAISRECGDEPFKKRTAHGMILGEGGEKMSKSRGNVVNPDEIVENYGADTMRVYEMFMGPFDQAIPWDTKGLIGVRRFLERVFIVSSNLINDFQSSNVKAQMSKLIHKTVKKVSEDIESMKFNTAISTLMIQFNGIDNNPDWRPKIEKMKGKYECDIEALKIFLRLLAPFAPHLAEELWHELGNKNSIHLEKWPEYDPALIVDEEIELVVQVNGKLRDKIKIKADLEEEEVKKIVLGSEKVKNWIDGKKIRQIVFVKGKLMNIVT
jgi:leucyl-tRNA synthetase